MSGYSDPAKPQTKEEWEAYIKIWEKSVDTQMHFNEMSGKARQFGLTFVAAALGLGVVILTRGQEFVLTVPYLGWEIHAIVLLIVSSAFALFAVRLLDLNVYYRMLRGAVTFGEDFEEKYMKQIFQLEKGMTQAISHYSRHQDAGVTGPRGSYHYEGKSEKNAETKVRRFYNVSIWTLVITAVILFLFTANFEHRTRSDASSSAAPAGTTPSGIGGTNAK